MNLILTLRLDPLSFSFFEDLRRKYFPPERNFIPAHLTLFHQLPAAEYETRLRPVLERLSALSPIDLEFTVPRFMGFGTAVEVRSPRLSDLFGQLQGEWLDLLSPQDKRHFRPHITVQNKVPAAEAKAFYAQFSAGWAPRTGRGEGLCLWEYLGGPWRRYGEVSWGD